MSTHFEKKKKKLIGMRERYSEQQTLFTLDHIFRFHYSVSFFSALPSFLFMFLCLSGFLSFLPFALPFLMCFPFSLFSSLLGFSSFSIHSFLLSFFPSFLLSFCPFILSIVFSFLAFFLSVILSFCFPYSF